MPPPDHATASVPLSAFPRSRSDQKSAKPGAIFVGGLACLLHFLRFGYAYGDGTQDRFLPLVLHRLNATFFASDWYVRIEAEHPGLLLPFVTLLEGMAQVLTLWLSVLLLHVAAIVGLGAALYGLAHSVTGSRAAAVATTILALVVLPYWSPDGSPLASGMLLPETLAWAAAYASLLLHLRGRPVWAGVLMGTASLIQPIAALFPTAVLFAHLATRPAIPWRPRLDGVLRTLMGYLLAALPMLIRLRIPPPIQASEADAYPPLFYILAEFREPMLLAGQFQPSFFVRAALLLVAGLAGYVWLRRRENLQHSDFLFAGLNVLAIFLVFGYLFTALVPVLDVVFLEPFRATTFAAPFLLAGVAGGLLCAVPRRAHAWIERRLDTAVRAAFIVILTVIGLLSLSERALLARVHPLAHDRTGLGIIEDWAARATDQRATFLVPPSSTSFRSNARRSIVVNYAAAPSSIAHARTWYQRLLSIAPVPLPEHMDEETLNALDAAYRAQSPARLAALALQYNAEYVLIDRQIVDPERLLEVFEADGWYVYLPVEMPGPRLTQITRGAAHGHR